jgi:hypothetical protein
MENTSLVVREAVRGDSGRFHGRKWTGRACGGPEECMVDRKGKRKAGNESEGYNWAGKCRSGVWEAGAQLECRICEKRTFSMYCGKSPYNVSCPAQERSACSSLSPPYILGEPANKPALQTTTHFPWEKSVWKHVMCFQCVFPEEK